MYHIQSPVIVEKTDAFTQNSWQARKKRVLGPALLSSLILPPTEAFLFWMPIPAQTGKRELPLTHFIMHLRQPLLTQPLPFSGRRRVDIPCKTPAYPTQRFSNNCPTLRHAAPRSAVCSYRFGQVSRHFAIIHSFSMLLYRFSMEFVGGSRRIFTALGG